MSGPEQIAPLSVAELQVSGLSSDSRTVQPGDLFFAIPGGTSDGRRFIANAMNRGAVGVVSESPEEGVPTIVVPNIRRALAEAAAAFYRYPSRELQLFGVTGTNGKTSVCWILAHALSQLNGPALYIGTLGMTVFGASGKSLLHEEINHTSPDPIRFSNFLRRAVDLGVRSGAVEVSSHALDQDRLRGTAWNGAAFTNLTRDHLDYHKTFEAYGSAKARLFSEGLGESTKERRVAVINGDDPFSEELKRSIPSGVEQATFSLRPEKGTLSLLTSQQSAAGTELTVKGPKGVLPLTTQLVGGYNIENTLAAFLLLYTVGFPEAELVEAFSRVPPVPGRLEPVRGAGRLIMVDYAHTPDALRKALLSIRGSVLSAGGRVITVFGCGGERDRGKRPLMAEAVGELSDLSIVTSDNPRSEDPSRIIEDVIPGFPAGSEYLVEADRRAALRLAISQASQGDVILVAGKGHEPYQEIHGVRYPFSDAEVCRSLLTSPC